MTTLRRFLPALPAIALAACTANPFLAGYRGERLAPVPDAAVAAEPPAAGDARQIGTSRFLSSSRHENVDREAIEAARAVGADVVRWQVRQLDREQWVQSDPVYERRASGRGQFASYYPVPGSRDRWEYTACFWQRVTAPPAPAARPGPQAPPAEQGTSRS